MREEDEDEVEPTKLCFVVGPIGTDDSPQRNHSDWLLEMIIQPVMSNFPQVETKRADQITQPGMIDAQVINALLSADLVVADLSTLNPNAFYEIGIRHMAQKPIIHMQIAEEKIPFDVSLYRAIKYSTARPRDLRAAQEALKAQVHAVIADGYQVENPVTRTRGIIKIEQYATPETQLLVSQMQAMQSQIDRLESSVLSANDMAMRAIGSPPLDSSLYRRLAGFDNSPNRISSPRSEASRWQIIAEIDPTYSGSRNEIIAKIITLRTGTVVEENSTDRIKIVMSPAYGRTIRRMMDTIKKVPGISNVHSAETIPPE